MLNALQNVFWWITSFQGSTPQPHPIYTSQTAFWEHLLHKQMESVFAYILTTNKAINTKLNRNVKQVKYYIKVYN